MSCYISKYVVCPYYHRHDNNRICCEGVDDTNTSNLVFENSRKQKEYSKKHCNSMEGHKECRFFKMLEEKYREEN